MLGVGGTDWTYGTLCPLLSIFCKEIDLALWYISYSKNCSTGLKNKYSKIEYK
jgi:hypothetical protein